MSLDEHSYEFGDRRYRVRGLDRNSTFERLQVNVLVRRGDEEDFHLDTLDLYSARQRSSFPASGRRRAGRARDGPEARPRQGCSLRWKRSRPSGFTDRSTPGTARSS